MSSPPPREDDDETICFCIGVSRRQLREAMHQQDCRTLSEVVRATAAMGGCMTCRIDIEEVIRHELPLLETPPTDKEKPDDP